MSVDTSRYLRRLYERSASMLRWQVIGLVAVTYLIVDKNIAWVTMLLVTAVVYNASTYSKSLASRDILGAKWLEITVNFGLIAVLILLTGGLLSPYSALLLIIILVASYWYGYPGMAYSAALLVVFWSTQLFVQPVYELSYLVFAIFTFIAGDYAVQLGKLTRREQEQIEHDTTAIMRQRKRLFSLVNGLSQAIFVVDMDGRIVVYNGAALELLDTHYEIERLAAAEVAHLYNKEGKEVFPLQHVLSSGEPYSDSDLQLKLGKQERLDVYVNITPMVEDGERVGALMLLRDISEQKSLDNQKDEFISIISHELRTPVAIVEADLSTLMLPKFAQLPEHATKLLNNAYQNLTFLASLLKDLSNLASSERSLLETEISQLKPTVFANSIVEGIRPKIEEQGLKLRYSHTTGIKPVITSQGRVEEIIVNFLTNAMKYGGKKGSVIEFRIEPSKEYSGGVRFTVKDSGIGMKKQDQTQLFKKFFRSDNPQAQAVKGTGMGLYISKKQADKIGAKISFVSSLGKGSAFYLDIPKDIRSG